MILVNLLLEFMEKIIYFIIVICSITSCRTGLEIAQNEIDNSIMFEASAIEGIYLNHEMSNKFGTFCGWP